ncbi:MAG: FAD-binding oxidoreductase [Planctomycetota bacterium]
MRALRARGAEALELEQAIAGLRERIAAQDRASASGVVERGPAWRGLRRLRVLAKRKANAVGDVVTLELGPVDGRPLPSFVPGQYLRFSFEVPGRGTPVVRCYSLSTLHGPPTRYSVTVKRVPGGAGSGFVHDGLEVGDTVRAAAPAGDFGEPLLRGREPVVLIAAGVGLTPMRSMLDLLCEHPDRPTHLIVATPTPEAMIDREALEALAAEHAHVTLWTRFSRVEPGQRVTVPWLLDEALPGLRDTAQFFMCGPTVMTQQVTAELAEHGVAQERIHCEYFGAARPAKGAGGPEQQITLRRSARTLTWEGEHSSLLGLLDAEGVDTVLSGCWQGACRSCETRLVSGDVRYTCPTPPELGPGKILPCVCTPTSNLILDA